MSASAATAEEFQFTTKKEETDTIIRHNLYWAMGASIVPIPLFDMAAITGIQLKMLNEFSKLYDIPFSKNAGKSIIASLIGSIGPVGMAQGGVGILVKFVPGIGQYVSYATLPVVAGAFTYAVGKVFVQHFEAGGTFLDFDPVAVKKYFAEQFQQGKKEAAKSAEENKKTEAKKS